MLWVYTTVCLPIENTDPGMVCGSRELRTASEHVDCGALHVTTAFVSPGITSKGGRITGGQLHSRIKHEMCG